MQGSAQRSSARKQAAYQRDQIELDRKYALAKMEGQLRQTMEQGYLQAGEIETQTIGNARMAYEETYLGQLGAERNYSAQMAASERSKGELTAAMGSSGAKEDVTLQNVIDREIQQELAGERHRIDTTRDLATTRTGMQIDSMKQAQAKIYDMFGIGKKTTYTTGGKSAPITVMGHTFSIPIDKEKTYDTYQGGSAYMDMYYLQQEEINKKADLGSKYASQVIQDNEYNLNWFMADMMNVTSGVLNVASMGYNLNLWGNPNSQLDKFLDYIKPADWTSVNTGYQYAGGHAAM